MKKIALVMKSDIAEGLALALKTVQILLGYGCTLYLKETD